MSSSKTIIPATIGGYSRKIQAGIMDEIRGGLAGRTFLSRSPPDIQPQTRIISLCGITDYTTAIDGFISSDEDENPPVGAFPGEATKKSRMGKFVQKTKEKVKGKLLPKEKKESKRVERKKTAPDGFASPREGGWFLSDFYLFHHLFRGLGSNQLWLTCESPRYLVRRYGEYAHGDVTKDLRVFLDEDIVPDLEESDIRVFQRNDLLQDFLRTFQAECVQAARLGQPVLLMIFGHGDTRNYGVAIGGGGHSKNAPRLRTQHIAHCLRGLDIKITDLLTSCYSGGWVLQPELNITALTAAGPQMQSFSWSETVGGRAHGSVYATAVRKAFIEMEDENATQINPYRSLEPGAETRESSTYAELADTIYDTLLYEPHTSGFNVQSSAQNDDWESEWRLRSGFPIAEYQVRWLQLRALPTRQSSNIGSSKPGALKRQSFSDTESYELGKGTYGLHKRFSEQQAQRIVRDTCHGHLSSNPPLSNSAPDRHVHRLVRSMEEGEKLSKIDMDDLRAALTYRNEKTKQASEYKACLGSEFPDCNDFNVNTWVEKEFQGEGGKAAERGSPKYKRYLTCLDMIEKADVFSLPTSNQGYHYNKPEQYLAIACVESKLGKAQVDDALVRMLADKEKQVESQTLKVRKVPTERTVGSKYFTTLGKRMRSASPRKRLPIPSFSEVMAQ